MSSSASSYKPVLWLNNVTMWLFLIGIVLIVMGKDLFAEGMFVDGVTYASISRNMAEGQGSFWDPFYTQTLYPHFRQHPPLAIGMEALWFKAFGAPFYLERLYSLFMFLFSGLLIALIWKRTTNLISIAWLPLLFWIAMPLATWSARNNMLENTMTVFVLLSVYLMLIRYQHHHIVWLFLSAFPFLMAFLSKGFTGLFPLVFPVVYCAFDQHYRWIQGVVDSILLVFTLAVLMGLMFLIFPDSFSYIKDYLQLQVLGGGLHEVTVSTRFYIVFKLLQELVIPLLLLVLVFVLRKALGITVKVFEFPNDKLLFFVFLILGLCGVLPIMVSVKQSGFYMVAALPFFALALGYMTMGFVQSCKSKITPNHGRRMLVTGLSYVVLTVGVVMPLYGINKYCRDEVLLKEVKEILATTDGESILGIAPADYQQWKWHAYFMRYGKVSLDDNNPQKYLLLNDSGHLKTILTSDF